MRAEFSFRWKPLEAVKGAGTEETAPVPRWGACFTALSDTKVHSLHHLLRSGFAAGAGRPYNIT
jgi:hypothetical protein